MRALFGHASNSIYDITLIFKLKFYDLGRRNPYTIQTSHCSFGIRIALPEREKGILPSVPQATMWFSSCIFLVFADTAYHTTVENSENDVETHRR